MMQMSAYHENKEYSITDTEWSYKLFLKTDHSIKTWSEWLIAFKQPSSIGTMQIEKAFTTC